MKTPLYRSGNRSLQWLVTIAAQGFWSVASFGITLFLARSITLHEFGEFAVGTTVRFFLLMILAALALSPMVLIVSQYAKDEKRENLLRTITFGFIALSLAFVSVAVAIRRFIEWPVVEFSIYVVGGLASELQRRINYINNWVYKDLAGGLIAIAGSIGGLLIVAATGALTLSKIYLVLGIVSLLWTVQSGWAYWLRPPTILDIKGLMKIWRIGRWGLGTNLAAFSYGQASTFFTLGLVGTAGVAVLELGRQFVLPIQVLLMGAANMWQPKIARSAIRESPGRFRQEIWQIARTQTLVGTILLLTILFLSPYLIPWLVPGKEQAYAASHTVSWVLAFGMICQLLWQHPSFGVVALGKPQYGFITRCVTSMLLIPAGYFLTKRFGVVGAAWTRALGEFSVLVLSVIMLNRAARNKEKTDQSSVEVLEERGPEPQVEGAIGR